VKHAHNNLRQLQQLASPQRKRAPTRAGDYVDPHLRLVRAHTELFPARGRLG
jgi:hypothetical protein